MQVEDALREITKLLKELRFGSDDLDMSYGATTFSRFEFGGMALTGNERGGYIRCLNALVTAVDDEVAKAIKKNGPKRETSFSRKGLENLLQTTLLKAWDAEEGLQQIPEQRIQAAVKWLRKELTAPPQAYVVYMAAVGVDQANLPVTVGKLTFFSADSPVITQLRDLASTRLFGSGSDNSKVHDAKQQFDRMMQTVFTGTTLIELEVRAGDEESAKEKAVTIARQTMDVMNFFSDLLYDRDIKACMALVGEGQEVADGIDERRSTKLTILMIKSDGDGDNIVCLNNKYMSKVLVSKQAKGPLRGLWLPRPGSAWPSGAIEGMFGRLIEVLAKDPLSPLEDRILSAFQWAGRATVAARREEAFAFYMIALESLVLGRKQHNELLYKLKLRTVHMLGTTVQKRKEMMRRLDDLYEIRSQIVHSGRFQVTDSELLEARQYAKAALVTVMHAEPFRAMDDEQQLDSWLEEQVLAGSRGQDTSTNAEPTTGEATG
jgi:Apea-like HEPN